MLKCFFSLLFLPLFAIINFFSKKKNKKKKLIFYSPYGYSGNTKYAYDYFCLNDKFDCIYIFDDVPHHQFEKPMICLKELNAFKKVIFFKNVDFLFLTHGIGKNPLYTYMLCIVQLWHGLPIKKILLDNKNDYLLINKNKLHDFCYAIFKLRLSLYDYLYTTDSEAGLRLVNAFQFPDEKVIYGNSFISKYIMDLPKDSKLYLNDKHSILYCPTWRDGKNDAITYAINIINSLSEEFNVNVKFHPFDFLKYEDDIFKLIPKEYLQHQGDDLNTILNKFNYIISDYSSLMYDNCFNNTILFTPDIVDYLSYRDIYESCVKDIQDVTYVDINKLKSDLMTSKIRFFEHKNISNNNDFFALENILKNE